MHVEDILQLLKIFVKKICVLKLELREKGVFLIEMILY